MNGLPYYKAYPRDFIEGTVGMPFELKAAYRLVLDLIYMQGGKLPDDARYISGLLGCSVKKWLPMRAALLEAGKLTVSQGYLGNHRADKELDSLKSHQTKQRDNRASGWKNKGLRSELVQPKTNHTEPEPEPERSSSRARAHGAAALDGETDQGAVPASPGAAPDDTTRERLLAAMGVGPDGVTGPASFIGTMADMAEARGWAALGLSIEAQCRVISEACHRQRSRRPDWQPRRFAYFTAAMRDAATTRTDPAPSAPDMDRKRAQWRKIAARHSPP